MADIFIYQQFNNILYLGTNSTNEIANGFKSGVEIPQKLEIPQYHEGKPIQAIGSYAFFQIHEIYEVIIQARVIEIHRAAFHGCTNLRSINIPSTCTFLGQSAIDGRVVPSETEKGYGPIVYHFEKGSSIKTISTASFCNYNIIIMIINDVVNPSCQETSFLSGTEKWTIYSPYSFTICGKKTTQLCKLTFHKSISLIPKHIIQSLFLSISSNSR